MYLIYERPPIYMYDLQSPFKIKKKSVSSSSQLQNKKNAMLFWTGFYITNVRVVSLAHKTPTGPPLHPY